ncbi:hypothetical protein EGY19_30405 [Burkholderia multivorans]|nr:hypothetical protein EGY19_30405 [Burkholderia multivorans]PRF40794.1 hypothetical protein C6Q04_31875 [Burkholderia multivorans]
MPSHALACIGHVDGKAHDRRSRDRQRVPACCASLSESLCVRHKLMAKEPLYATQTQGRSDD